jgi:transketolase
MSQLARLSNHGQSFWLDSLSRQMLEDGSLAARVQEQGLRGVTSNPAIFAEAMIGSHLYDPRIRVALETMQGAEEVYVALAVADVRDACDLLLPVYERTDGEDGFVSLEVSPHLAYDPVGTVRQARTLWDAVGRPNLLVKVPGTDSGLHAVEVLLQDGININITLLFGLDAYRETIQVYLRAMERRLQDGRDLRSVASVASFFLSRIDVAVDRELRLRIHPEVDGRLRREAEALLGKAAVANARLAYDLLQQTLASERWQRLAEAGARPQRLVWASTGTKDPAYPEAMYIEPLIGSHTVSTMPAATADAFDEHGRVEETLGGDVEDASEVMDRLNRVMGIDFDAITRHLVGEGVQKFIDPYDKLLAALDKRCARMVRAEQAEPLKGVADRLRAEVIRMTTEAGSGHATSCLSCAELVAALFFHEMRWDPHAPGIVIWTGSCSRRDTRRRSSGPPCTRPAPSTPIP